MKQVLEQQFKSSYNRKSFIENILNKLFYEKCNNYQVFDDRAIQNIQLNDSEKSIAKSLVKYGTLITKDDRKIDLYEVILHDNKLVEKNKVGISSLVKKQIIGNNAVFVNFAYETPENKNWRFSFIAFDSVFEKGDINTKETNPKRYTYVFGEKDETYKTAIDRFFKLSKELDMNVEKIKEAFAVEAMSNKFFNEYRDIHYKAFIDYLSSSNFKKSVFNGDEKSIRDFVKKLLGRIVFLYFIQKKGWLGASSIDYLDGDKNFIKTLFALSGKNENFYSIWLSKLFFDTLNEKRTADNFEMPDGKVVKIPYLNGGLFEKDKSDYDFIVIDVQLFKNLFEFFDQYNFTVYEDSSDDHTIAVDPEMLGHIFENLLEDNKDKGAFYTPKEIVHYMTQESLIEYLHTHLSDISIENLTDFVKGKDVKISKSNFKKIETLLDNVKICDPAIGSGAFPMGLLQEIFSLKERIAFLSGFKVWSPATVKEHIIQNSIYGVDIEKGAVDIARLRFWLSLIVDEDKPKPLPNLDYKIVVGNSLVSKFEDEVIEIDWELKEKKQGDLYNGEFELENKKQELLKKISEKQSDYFYSETKNKEKIATEIRKLKLEILSTQLELMIKQSGETYIAQGKKTKKQLETELTVSSWKRISDKINRLKKNNEIFEHFDWKLDFPEILNPLVANGKSGFDIIIANPPYLKERNNAHIFDEVNQSYLGSKWHQGKMDYWFYFLHKAIDIINNKSIIAFITSRYWLNSQGSKKLIKRLKENLSFTNIVDIGKLKVFDNVSGHHIIHIYSKLNRDLFTYKIISEDLKHISYNFKTKHLQIAILNNKEVFSSQDEIILSANNFKFESSTIYLGDLYDISQGVVEASDKISRKQYEKVGRNNVNIGDGIFVLNKNELNKLNLNESEKKLLKKYLNPNSISRYLIDESNFKYLIYTDSKYNEIISGDSNYSNIKRHLDFYSDFITSSNKPYSIHRTRKEKYFSNKKIIFKNMFKYPDFSYDEGEFFFGFSCSSIIQNDKKKSLKFLLSILNSKLACKWFYVNGKQRGIGVDIGVEKLRTFPIKETEKYNIFEILVDYILFLNKFGQINSYSEITLLFEEVIDAMVFELYFPEDFKKANINIIKYVERDFKPIEGLEIDMQKNVIHESYQKLRETNNEIINNIELMKIELRCLLMPIIN